MGAGKQGSGEICGKLSENLIVYNNINPSIVNKFENI
jgi:hypothetical protein